MKIRNILLILLMFIISSSFMSCEKTEIDNIKESDELYRATCIIPHKDDKAYWSVIEEGLNDGARDNNIDLKIVYPSLNYDVEQMLKLTKMAIASKVDCIIISGVEDESFYQTVQEAVDKGIFVIFVDTDMKDLDNVVYVGSNNFEAGVIFAQNIAKVKNEKVNIGIISGDSYFDNLRKRYEGIKSIVDDYQNMNIVDLEYDKFDYSTVYKIYNDYINNNDIDTIVCLEGTAGMALNSYLTNKPDIDIFVFDDTPQALEGLEKDYFKGMMIQQKYYMGYKVVEEIALYRKNKNSVPRKIYTDTYFIEDISEKK